MSIRLTASHSTQPWLTLLMQSNENLRNQQGNPPAQRKLPDAMAGMEAEHDGKEASFSAANHLVTAVLRLMPRKQNRLWKRLCDRR